MGKSLKKIVRRALILGVLGLAGVGAHAGVKYSFDKYSERIEGKYRDMVQPGGKVLRSYDLDRNGRLGQDEMAGLARDYQFVPSGVNLTRALGTDIYSSKDE